MAKTKSFSHIEAQDALEVLSQSKTTGEELVYDLLRIFCGYGDGSIRRVREGIGNKAKDGRTILIPNVIAYRPQGNLDPYEELRVMQNDAKIAKQSPRLYVVSDGTKIYGADPKEQDLYENEVALMWKDFDFFYPMAGIEKFTNTEEAEADVKSAELMAKIFDEIRRHNDVKDKAQMHHLNVFMSRLLFCYFAEDTHLFPEENLFTNSIRQHTDEDGHDLAAFIDRAFVAMSTGDAAERAQLPSEFAAFPYVNGGLFEQRLPIPTLSRRTRVLMIKCGDYNWADINPDIFGSMIQAVVTPEMRAGLGMHYTSVPNIMKLIRPLFLDELMEEFTNIIDPCRREMADFEGQRKEIAERMHADTSQRAACTAELQQLDKKRDRVRQGYCARLDALRIRLSQIKFFDPACGSGNFLIITYKRIRDLEILIWDALLEQTQQALTPHSDITLTQFYGIEIDEFARDTATLSLWLAEHQMNNRFNEAFGVRPNALPLRPSGHIVCGNACRLDWEDVCPHTKDEEVYVMGNPPYLGSKLQDEAQKADMKVAMEGTDAAKTIDYIGAWFWKGAQYIQHTRAKYAFVTTNSISQGEQVAMLWKPIFDLGLVINFARTSFKWSNNAKNNATVTCAIIGVSDQFSGKRRLFDEAAHTENRVDNINPYLSAGENVIVEKRNQIPAGLTKACFGCMAYDHGNLILSQAERDDLIEKYPEVKPLIKRLMGSQEFIQDEYRYCLWIDDEDLSLAKSIPEIDARIEATRKFRLYGAEAAGEDLVSRSHQFREYFKRDSDAIIIPSVSSERREYIPIGFVDKNTVISNLAFAIYNAKLWLFGVLTSKMHNLWVRAVGGALETRIRYSATLCYNTFPFPKINEAQKAELETLAQTVIDIRDQNFDMTLGEMYNPETMPGRLKEAHHQLDLAVERCYRPEPFTSDEERLEYLFKLYVKMTKK
jgi:hypothetical protein